MKKELIWIQPALGNVAKSHTPFFWDYKIYVTPLGTFRAIVIDSYSQIGTKEDVTLGSFLSLDNAKEACQEHYEKAFSLPIVWLTEESTVYYGFCSLLSHYEITQVESVFNLFSVIYYPEMKLHFMSKHTTLDAAKDAAVKDYHDILNMIV